MRSIAAAVLFAMASVIGCSDDRSDDVQPQTTVRARPIVLKPEAVRAPRAVSDEASVEPGRIVLSASGGDNAAWTASLAAGSIIVGNRDTKSASLAESKNPYGFLRKVLTVKTEGEAIVITTEQAYLTDLIEEGDLVFGKDGPSIFPDAIVAPPTTSPRNVNVGPLANGGAGASTGSGEAAISGELTNPGGRNAITPILRFANGRFAVNASFTGELSLGRTLGIPTSVQKANVRLDLDPVASVELEWGGALSRVQADGSAILNQTWRGPTIPIPLPGPVPMTLRLQPEIGCAVSVGGEITARSRVSMRGHAAAGFKFAGSSDLVPIYDEPKLEVGHDFIGVQGKATLRGECSISGVLAVLAFDAIGIEGKVGPYAAIEATVCAATGAQGVTGDLAVFEEHGTRADLSGRLQIPGIAFPVVTRPIFSMPSWKNGPNYLVGDELKCTARSADSCVGKPDGIYCSELNDFSAYECKGTQIASGQQCADNKKCTGPNGPGTKMQCQ
jgi:hypothetical protein